jgi:hypothetical protein
MKKMEKKEKKSKLTGGEIVLIVVIILFLLIDVLIIIALFIEKSKFEDCKNIQNPFCPFIACNQSNGSANVDEPIDNNTPEWQACLGNAYRFINPNAADKFAPENIQCLYGYGGSNSTYEIKSSS